MSGKEIIQTKLVFLGEAAVGKSSIVLRFVKDEFSLGSESTIGAAFLTAQIDINERQTVKYEIWDTAGQERFHSLAPMYYRGAQAAIVVYDITSPSSFERAKAWVSELQVEGNPDVVIALAGNKADMEDSRAISEGQGKVYAEKLGLVFMECSAKTGQNVKELFNEVAKRMPRISSATRPQPKTTTVRPGANRPPPEDSGCC
mmetsp:Transcript_33239/g.56783  ORF Transcript_33239/g.56783 Transcript_33239/m.56783 type:complete len:202 (+) Transcript_33239:28-633(+)